ncbi:unnamed protein product, partial [Mycena citricolor]
MCPRYPLTSLSLQTRGYPNESDVEIGRVTGKLGNAIGHQIWPRQIICVSKYVLGNAGQYDPSHGEEERKTSPLYLFGIR